MILDRLGPEEMVEVSIVFEESAKLGLRLLKDMYDLRQSGTQSKGEIQKTLVEYARTTPFVFRGNMMDLSYFWGQKTLPLTKINELPEGLREEVFCCFAKLQEQGLVSFDGTVITLTDAGYRHIHDTNYISAVIKADEDLNLQIQNGLANAMGKGRFKPQKPQTGQNPNPEADVKQAGGNVAETPRAPTATAEPAQAGSQIAQTGAQAAEAGAKTVASTTGAATTAGITIAAQVAQETVVALNKSINNLMTH